MLHRGFSSNDGVDLQNDYIRHKVAYGAVEKATASVLREAQAGRWEDVMSVC